MVTEPVKNPKTRPMWPRAFTQARQLQELAFKSAFDAETTPAAQAQLMRAWDVLEERKRVLRMRPAPKPVEVPAPGQRRRQRRAERVEPVDGPHDPSEAPKST